MAVRHDAERNKRKSCGASYGFKATSSLRQVDKLRRNNKNQSNSPSHLGVTEKAVKPVLKSGSESLTIFLEGSHSSQNPMMDGRPVQDGLTIHRNGVGFLRQTVRGVFSVPKGVLNPPKTPKTKPDGLNSHFLQSRELFWFLFWF